MIRYREADKSDISAMARIRSSEWKTEEFWRSRIAGYLAGTHHPQMALPPRIMYIALQDDSVAGFIAGHLTRRYECEGELQWINVAKESQKQGVAGGLFELLAAWFVAHNASRICVDVDPANETARRFYMRHGAVRLNDHWLVWNDIKARGGV